MALTRRLGEGCAFSTTYFYCQRPLPPLPPPHLPLFPPALPLPLAGLRALEAAVDAGPSAGRLGATLGAGVGLAAGLAAAGLAAACFGTTTLVAVARDGFSSLGGQKVRAVKAGMAFSFFICQKDAPPTEVSDRPAPSLGAPSL